eukprot:gene25685-11350_t
MTTEEKKAIFKGALPPGEHYLTRKTFPAALEKLMDKYPQINSEFYYYAQRSTEFTGKGPPGSERWANSPTRKMSPSSSPEAMRTRSASSTRKPSERTHSASPARKPSERTLSASSTWGPSERTQSASSTRKPIEFGAKTAIDRVSYTSPQRKPSRFRSNSGTRRPPSASPTRG